MGLIFSRNYEKIEKLFKEFRKKDYFSELTESKGGGETGREEGGNKRGGERQRGRVESEERWNGSGGEGREMRRRDMGRG